MAWLADVIAEETDPKETKRAAKLLEKLAKYKQLPQTSKLEQQNYNMVDNVQGTGYSSFNNGAGEKAQKEEYKANENFSGRGHAIHICKACSRLGAAQKAAAIDMNCLMGYDEYGNVELVDHNN